MDMETTGNKGCQLELETAKMLTISTMHISIETAELLEVDGIPEIVQYPKAEYGWFIYTPSDKNADNLYDCKNIPEDLLKCMRFAKDHGYTWLCLDIDGPEMPNTF